MSFDELGYLINMGETPVKKFLLIIPWNVHFQFNLFFSLSRILYYFVVHSQHYWHLFYGVVSHWIKKMQKVNSFHNARHLNTIIIIHRIRLIQSITVSKQIRITTPRSYWLIYDLLLIIIIELKFLDEMRSFCDEPANSNLYVLGIESCLGGWSFYFCLEY